MIAGRALLSDEFGRKSSLVLERSNFGDSAWQAGVLLYHVSDPSDS